MKKSGKEEQIIFSSKLSLLDSIASLQNSTGTMIVIIIQVNNFPSFEEIINTEIKSIVKKDWKKVISKNG